MNQETRKGFPFYGQTIGILVLKGTSKRFVGDLGHADTFDYQVQYEVLDLSFNELLEYSEVVLNKITSACEALVNKGAKAILGDCGLLSLYQDQVAKLIRVPVGLSSLIQIPLAWELIGKQGQIGIITGHQSYLSNAHLAASGWREDIKISVKGLESFVHFNESIIKGNIDPVPKDMMLVLQNAVRQLISENEDIRTVVLECSNLSSYTHHCTASFDLPFFDALTLANYLKSVVNPKRLL